MSTSREPAARLEAEARLLQLTDEIDQLRIDLGLKIDEATELMERLRSWDATSSQDGSRPDSQDSLEPQFRRPRSRPSIAS